MTFLSVKPDGDAGEKTASFREELACSIRRTVGEESEVIFRNDLGLNGIIHPTVTIRTGRSRIAPTIGIEEHLESYRRGVPAEEIARRICGMLKESPKGPELFNPEEWEDYSRVRSRLGIKLISAAKNELLLREVPGRIILDLAAIVVYFADCREKSRATVTVRNDHLDRWGITGKTLLEDAFLSGPEMMPPQVRSIEEALRMTGCIPEEFPVPGFPEENPADGLFVLSNPWNYLGASAAVYPGVLASFADAAGCDLFVIPSSIHEVLLLPARDGGMPEELDEMVREINSSEVSPEEVLSDHVYYYGRKTGLTIPAGEERSAQAVLL